MCHSNAQTFTFIAIIDCVFISCATFRVHLSVFSFYGLSPLPLIHTGNAALVLPTDLAKSVASFPADGLES